MLWSKRWVKRYSNDWKWSIEKLNVSCVNKVFLKPNIK
jgi:hypothetical protein